MIAINEGRFQLIWCIHAVDLMAVRLLEVFNSSPDSVWCCCNDRCCSYVPPTLLTPFQSRYEIAWKWSTFQDTLLRKRLLLLRCVCFCIPCTAPTVSLHSFVLISIRKKGPDFVFLQKWRNQPIWLNCEKFWSYRRESAQVKKNWQLKFLSTSRYIHIE